MFNIIYDKPGWDTDMELEYDVSCSGAPKPLQGWKIDHFTIGTTKPEFSRKSSLISSFVNCPIFPPCPANAFETRRCIPQWSFQIFFVFFSC